MTTFKKLPTIKPSNATSAMKRPLFSCNNSIKVMAAAACG
jgi:hypothetical protein